MSVVLLVFLVLLAMAFTVFMVLTGVGIFEKAGTPGWKSAIVFINTINFFEIMSSSDVFWGMLFTGAYVLFLGLLIPVSAGLFKTILIVIGAVVCFGFYAHNCIVGARRFGKSFGFAVGMMFLPFIFLPLLCFGDAEYNKHA